MVIWDNQSGYMMVEILRKKITISAKKLYHWYHEEEMTLLKIADKVDCSTTRCTYDE